MRSLPFTQEEGEWGGGIWGGGVSGWQTRRVYVVSFLAGESNLHSISTFFPTAVQCVFLLCFKSIYLLTFCTTSALQPALGELQEGPFAAVCSPLQLPKHKVLKG